MSGSVEVLKNVEESIVHTDISVEVEMDSEKIGKTMSNGELKSGPKKPVEGFDGIQDTDAKEYLNNYQAHKTGISHQEMVDVYSNWASNYDQDLCPGRYNGPEIAATEIAGYYPEQMRASVRILDVAAGTGRVGEELFKVGFRNMDALEPSEGMLNKLKERNIYTVDYQCAVGVSTSTSSNSSNIESDIYDCLVIAGGMGEGHIPVNALDEMIRVVKPGGTIFIVMREEYLTYVREYVNRLEPYMDTLQQQGLWKRIARKVVANYSFNKNGIVFSYQVLSKSS